MSEKASTPASSGGGDNTRNTLATVLTRFAHFSTPFISTFLVIHLSAPIMATVGGSELSSKVMLLGREYYQTPFGQTFLVLTPVAVHTTAVVLKRLLAPHRTPRKFTSTFALAGYTALLLAPIHYLLHREYPADPSPPTLGFGPSELDYEFVKYGLQTWPLRSWFLYGGMTAAVLWHAAAGMQIEWNTWMRGLLGPWPATARQRGVTVGALVLCVLSGLAVLAREPLMALASDVTRFEGAFAQSFAYRL